MVCDDSITSYCARSTLTDMSGLDASPIELKEFPLTSFTLYCFLVIEVYCLSFESCSVFNLIACDSQD